MWPWKMVVRYAFYSVLALYTLLEVTESRDGMFQEIGKVAEKVKERKLAKAKKKLEEEEEKRQAQLADKQPLLEEARRRVLAAQQQKKRKLRVADLLAEEEEDVDPFLPVVQARSILEKILKEAEAQAQDSQAGGAAAVDNEASAQSAPVALPEDPVKQRALLGQLMVASLLNDDEVKLHLEAGRVLHSDLAAAAADWAQMLDEEEVEEKMAELQEDAEVAAA